VTLPPDATIWRVNRTAGLLPRGCTKRFQIGADGRPNAGLTSFIGIPIGRFDVVYRSDGNEELWYRRWPVVDVLHRREGSGPNGTRIGTGNVRVPRGRRVRFCRFELVAID